MKTCTKCNETKELSNFYKAKNNLDGHRNDCKECCAAYNKEWQKKNPEKARKAWRKAEAKSRDGFRRRASKYGLTKDQLKKMLDDANGVCAICGREPNNYLVIDHCHTSGKVRDVLCEPCNQALGLFADNIEYMQSAIEYLKKHKPV